MNLEDHPNLSKLLNVLPVNEAEIRKKLAKVDSADGLLRLLKETHAGLGRLISEIENRKGQIEAAMERTIAGRQNNGRGSPPAAGA